MPSNWEGLTMRQIAKITERQAQEREAILAAQDPEPKPVSRDIEDLVKDILRLSARNGSPQPQELRHILGIAWERGRASK